MGEYPEFVGVRIDKEKFMKLFKTIAVAASCLSLVFGTGVMAQASTSSINPLQSPVPPTATSTNNVRCTVVRGIRLNVRSAPSIRARRIGLLRGGTTFACLSRVGNWLKLIYRGRVGWVYRPYVRCNRTI